MLRSRANREVSEDDGEHVADDSSSGSHEPDSNAAGRSLSLRALLVGMIVGILVNLTNMYYGLQAGTSLQMPAVSGLLGFLYFKALRRVHKTPLSPAENVLICSAATATGLMPVTAGFTQTIPALQYVLAPKDGGPIQLTQTQLLVWSLALSFFGIAFAALLRKRLVIQGPQPWPGATATAKTLRAIHGMDPNPTGDSMDRGETVTRHDGTDRSPKPLELGGWREQTQILAKWGLVSGVITLLMYFVPAARSIPVFGKAAADDWLWTMTASPGFIGQGIVMGPIIPSHMLLGASVGFGILSPLAKSQGWAPGKVDDWSHGSRAWITWIAVSALFADAMVNLLVVSYRVLVDLGATTEDTGFQKYWAAGAARDVDAPDHGEDSSSPLLGHDQATLTSRLSPTRSFTRSAVVVMLASFAVAVIACTIGVSNVFQGFPWYYALLAILLALPMSIIAIRCLAESDFNPQTTLVSHLIFAAVARQPKAAAIVANLLASGIACAGASQTGDLAYDLKIGHLVGADPNAQIVGHVVGSTFGAFVSIILYQLYVRTYPIPGPLLQIPSAFIDTNTSRLLLSRGTPPGTLPFIIGFGVFFTITTVIRMAYVKRRWAGYIPTGTSFAVGIYNLPALTLARLIGGWSAWLFIGRMKLPSDKVMMIGVALILGESLASVADLVFTALKVPRLTA